MKMKLALSAVATCLIASSAFAGPVSLTNAQMDIVSGGGFVCPVISTDAVSNSPLYAFPPGGFNTIIPPANIGDAVPAQAFNTLDGGDFGSPGGDYASPGDTGYTAIWN